MKVSVVIPAYNEEKYIGLCLQSLSRQLEMADEIIVVNNNSTDQTAKIAKSFKVTVIDEPQRGITFARNSGFNHAQYPIIARCDADSILPNDWIKRIKSNFEGKIDALTGPVIFCDLPIHIALSTKLYFFIVKAIQGFKNPLMGPNMVLTQEIWAKVKNEVCLQDHLVHEDIDLAIHINRAGGRIVFDPNLIIRVSGRRITNDPLSFFWEYPIRFVKTVLYHR